MFIQEYLSRYSTHNNGKILPDITAEKPGNDEHNVKSRGWLNWLSRGMLGAGGTDDSSQFSGVVSFDVKVHVFNYLLSYFIISRVGLFSVLALCVFFSAVAFLRQ